MSSSSDVERWFRQAASGHHSKGDAFDLQTWIDAVSSDPRETSQAVVDILLPLLRRRRRGHGDDHRDGHGNHVRFYALTTLGRLLSSLSRTSSRRQEQHAMATRRAVRQCLVYELTASDNSHDDDDDVLRMAFFRNKVAAVLVSLWSSYDDADVDVVGIDLRHLAQHAPSLYLRIVQMAMETVVVTIDPHQHDDDHEHHAVRRETAAWKALFKSTSSSTSSSSGVTLRRECFGTTIGLLQRALQRSNHNNNDNGGGNTHPNGSSSSAAAEDDETEMILALETVQACWAWTTDMTVWTTSSSSSSSFVTTTPTSTSPRDVYETLWHALSLSWSSGNVRIAVLDAWREWTTTTVVDDDDDAMRERVPVLSTVLQQIHALNLLPYQGESDADIEVVIAVARFVEAVGQRTMPWYNDSLHRTDDQQHRHAVGQLFGQVVDLFFRAFAYDDIDVSAAVIPLASTLVVNTPSTREEEKEQQHLPHLLNVLYRQMRYPVDFSYDFTDDVNAEEEMYRTELDKLYIRIIKAAPALVLHFLQQAVANVVTNHYHHPTTATATTTTATVGTPDVEATLRLVYHYAEGIQPPPGVKTVLQDEAFCSLLVTLQQGNLVHAQQHREVLRLYYETAVRYSALYTLNSQQPQAETLLANLLSALTGSHGLQHEHALVRSRCCYLLLRLVKSLIKLLRPLVQSAVEGICRLLSNPALSLRPDDTLYLFETIGLLLGKTGLAAQDQQTYLAQIMTPHVQSMERILATPDLLRDVETYGESLSRSIAAITCLSKGFTKQPPEPVQVVFLETIHITARVLEAMPTSETVRGHSMTLLQRMIQCLAGTRVLHVVPRYLAVLTPHCTADDCTFVAQIFNQVSLKFQSQAAAALDASFLPFLHKCQYLVSHVAVDAVSWSTSSEPVDVPPHLQTEQLAIQKLVFGVLSHIVCNQATAMLLSPTNAASLESVLRTTAEGAIHVMEPSVRKTCLRVFRELADQWIVQQRAGEVYQRGLLGILYQAVLPGVLVAMGSDEIDERDAQQFRVVSDFARLLFVLHSCGETENTLRSLHTSGVPSGSLDALRTANDEKAVETLLMSRLTEWKGR